MKKRDYLVVSVLGLSAFGLGQAWGQDTSDGEVVDKLVVFGQKFEQSFEDVTSSLDVVTSEEIIREPIVNVYDILNRIPNVSTSFGNQGFSIRGIGENGVSGAGQTATIYVDDSALGNDATNFGPLDSWDLAQVEVYRGPQSTNFGRNTLAGAIYVRTTDPSYEWDLMARTEVGNNGVFQGAIATGGPIIEDVLAFRVSANYRESEGFIENTFLDTDANSSELKTGRFKLLFEPTDSLKIISTSSYTENFIGDDFVSPIDSSFQPLDADDVTRRVAYDLPGRQGTETFIQSLNLTWDISDLFTFQSITTYQDTDYVSDTDFDRTIEDLSAFNMSGTDEAVSQELRLSYTGDRLKGGMGFYYFTQEETSGDILTFDVSLFSSLFPSSLLVETDSLFEFQRANYAFFADGEYAINDNLDLLFGFRYDQEKQENNFGQLGSIVSFPVFSADETIQQGSETLFTGFLQAAGLVGEVDSRGSETYAAWLPKVGVRYDITNDTAVSFVVQKAYRAGGVQILRGAGQVIDFDPEFLWNYEVAVRSSFFDDRLAWNTNIFYADWSDQQVDQASEGLDNFFFTVNAGKSTLYGFETDASFQATDRLEFYGGVGYSFTEFDDFPNAGFDATMDVSAFNQEDYDGNRFPNAPQWTINAGADYQHEGGLFGGVDVNYRSSAFSEIDNFLENELEESVVVNARAGYQLTDSVRLSAYVRNLLDTDYFTALDREDPEFFVDGALGQRRTYAVRLDFDF